MLVSSIFIDSNLIRNESVHHRGHGGRRDIIFSDETRMIADERRLKTVVLYFIVISLCENLRSSAFQ